MPDRTTMALLERTTHALQPHLRAEIEERWTDALAYFKRRGSVLFLSYTRFWEKHAFVQQSLAKLLVENGVKVTWLDSWTWRPYSPERYFQSPLLDVRPGVSLPFRRIRSVDRLAQVLQRKEIDKTLRSLGGDPVIWVQGGLEDRSTIPVPRLDVLSTFDDPYQNGDSAITTCNARVIVCQNSFTYSLLSEDTRRRAFVSLPPVEMDNSFSNDTKMDLPVGFSKKVMGYIGSFFPEDFDLPMFESFMKRFPDWGFLLMGRTRGIGNDYLRTFSRYRNFFHCPWVPRAQTAAGWKLLDVSLLFYRSQRGQDGAFPTKILESLHFGVPAIATAVPKTLDLEGFLPRSANAERLQELALETQHTSPARLQAAYDHFAFETNPKLHLARIAEALQGQRVVGLESSRHIPFQERLKIVPDA